VTTHQLTQLCRSQLEAYKVPKRFIACTTWPYTASGKTDHAALAAQLQQYLSDESAAPCMHRLP
jgi:long-chain acyl-CoA synthetase